MSTFTIDAENNIMAHAELPAGADESQSFSSAKELLWNSFAGVAPFDELKPVKKFTSRGRSYAHLAGGSAFVPGRRATGGRRRAH